jgi:hypothetical protein
MTKAEKLLRLLQECKERKYHRRIDFREGDAYVVQIIDAPGLRKRCIAQWIENVHGTMLYEDMLTFRLSDVVAVYTDYSGWDRLF